MAGWFLRACDAQIRNSTAPQASSRAPESRTRLVPRNPLAPSPAERSPLASGDRDEIKRLNSSLGTSIYKCFILKLGLAKSSKHVPRALRELPTGGTEASGTREDAEGWGFRENRRRVKPKPNNKPAQDNRHTTVNSGFHCISFFFQRHQTPL